MMQFLFLIVYAAFFCIYNVENVTTKIVINNLNYYYHSSNIIND